MSPTRAALADLPAFAGPDVDGMTVRQYLAARALQGLLANPTLLRFEPGAFGPVPVGAAPAEVAKVAMTFADALLGRIAT